MRARPLIGLVVLNGLRRTGENTWENGSIYDPDDGATYNASMSMQDDGALQVRAYVLMPMLGKTFVWTRMRAIEARPNKDPERKSRGPAKPAACFSATGLRHVPARKRSVPAVGSTVAPVPKAARVSNS